MATDQAPGSATRCPFCEAEPGQAVTATGAQADAHRDHGSTLCLREVVVTCGTYADPSWLNAAHVLCLRQLPCDNPNHKPERLTHGTR